MTSKKRNRSRTYMPNRKAIKGKFLLPLSSPTVYAPARVTLIKSRFNDDNYRFVTQLENALIKHDEITISFRRTKEVKATAMLVIYSLIDTYGKEKKVTIIPSESSKYVNDFISRTGDFKSPEHRLEMLEDKRLPIIQGNNAIVNALSRKIISTLDSLYLDSKSEDYESRKAEIGIAIVETLDNVGRHAYPDKIHEEKTWWFICEIIDGTLYMAIYDRGVGIPYSIRNSEIDFIKLMESYYCITGKDISQLPPTLTANKKDFSDTYSDKMLIGAAMSQELSKTTKDKHGKGSGTMKALIKKKEGSFLLIESGKGLYIYSKFNKEDENKVDERFRQLHNSIQGTLIQWSL